MHKNIFPFFTLFIRFFAKKTAILRIKLDKIEKKHYVNKFDLIYIHKM